MRTFGRPCASTVATDIAFASLGSVSLAPSIQASNSAKGSSLTLIPPSSTCPPMSLMGVRYHPGFARQSRSLIESIRRTKPHSSMSSESPERLPPPPFWRTRYFAFDVLPRRPYLDPLEIRRIVAQPERRSIQRDGRIRLHGYSESLGCY